MGWGNVVRIGSREDRGRHREDTGAGGGGGGLIRGRHLIDWVAYLIFPKSWSDVIGIFVIYVCVQIFLQNL